MNWLIVIVIILGLYSAVVVYFNLRYPELHWRPFPQPAELRFPAGFLWGVATSAHQVEGGCDNNNWWRWEQGSFPDGTPHILRKQRSGVACDHWNRFREDVALMKELGVQVYRFSVEWSKLEPEEGRFDQAAFNHYAQVLDALEAAGIIPMLTLHHFTNPLWFEDRGAFVREENLEYFVRFCEKVFRAYGTRVPWWCTVNEPAVVAVEGYFRGTFPPGERNPQLTAQVLLNLLRGHVRVYRRLKELPGGTKVQIGIVKDIFMFDPYRHWHLGDWLTARLLDKIFNGLSLEYLKTGVFKIVLPGFMNITVEEPEAVGTLDYLGLNCYSHMPIALTFKPPFFDMRLREDEIPTDMPYTMYPEGLYRAVQRAAELGVPIIVTENGIADARDDRRGRFIREYLTALHQAIEDGYDVRGYCYWSLMDNFEWTYGYDMKFGLYEVDFSTQERRLRKGAEVFRRIVAGNSVVSL